MENDLLKRRGEFTVTAQLIKNCSSRGREILSELFSKVIPVKAEYMFLGDCIKYEAIGEGFDIVDDAEETPYYEVRCTNGGIQFLKANQAQHRKL